MSSCKTDNQLFLFSWNRCSVIDYSAFQAGTIQSHKNHMHTGFPLGSRQLGLLLHRYIVRSLSKPPVLSSNLLQWYTKWCFLNAINTCLSYPHRGSEFLVNVTGIILPKFKSIVALISVILVYYNNKFYTWSLFSYPVTYCIILGWHKALRGELSLAA